MKIGEIAKAAGVSTSRIRFYERKGIIAPGARGPNGYRDYSADMVAVLRFIEQAQGLGFILREISEVGIGTGEHLVSCTDALVLLARKHQSITALIAEAQGRKQRIEVLMAQLEASRQKAASEA